MNLLGKAMDKNFWKEVREKDCYKKYRDELFYLWKNECEDKDTMALKYSDFKLYWVTGDRGVYERTYFSRRKAMDCAALLSLIYPEEEKYLIKLMDVIYAICDEYTWCLPAHQGQLEPNNNVKIDLFASETGFALSEIYTMLEDRLEPLIKNSILAETERRIVKPFTAVDNYGWWERGTNNWTAVCEGSVGCMLMLLYPDKVDEAMQERFAKSMECYLSGFTEDGMCLEGCGYWHYGFGFFTVYADMIRRFTDGKTDYFKRDKVRTIATFIQKMYLSGRSSVSFADGGRTLSYHLGLLHYLKNEYPDDVLVYDSKYSYNYDGCGRFCLQLRSAIWMDEEIFNNPAPDNKSAEYYAPESEWLIKRTSAYGFAGKGGNNAEHHNHNDVGTFIFAKNGRQVIMDLGSGRYSRQYFAADTRYTILECSSRGHNVPIVDGVNQFTSKDAKATATKYENGVFSMNIATAYKCDGLEAINRKFSFTEESVTLSDSFTYNGNGKITERLVTLLVPEITEPGTVKIEDVTVKYNPEKCVCTIDSEPKNERETCYFIDFALNKDEKEFSVEIS